MRPRRPGWRRLETGAVDPTAAVASGFGFFSVLADWFSGRSAKEERAAKAIAAGTVATAHAREVEAQTAWRIAQLEAATGSKVPPWAIAAGVGLAVYLLARKGGPR